MTHAYGRCWIHEDCISHPEIGAVCGPNPPDMQVLHGDWGISRDDWGDGWGDGLNYSEGDGNGNRGDDGSCGDIIYYGTGGGGDYGGGSGSVEGRQP